MGSAGHNRFTDANFKRGVCLCAAELHMLRWIYLYIYLFVYEHMCSYLYEHVYTQFLYVELFLCSKAFAAPPHPECTGHVFLEALSILYTTWVLPHAQYSL